MIVESSQEALRPEKTVDVVLHEILSAVKQLKGEDVKPGEQGYHQSIR